MLSAIAQPMNDWASVPETVRPAVLLVDDNEDIIDYIAQDLTTQYRVFTAQDGLEALALLQRETVDLIISDVMMPRLDGFAFCEAVKSKPELSHIPVILLTAHNTLPARIQGLKMGADAYVEKPFSLEFLHAHIENLLRNRLKLKECYARSPLVYLNSIAHTREDEHFWKQLTDMIVAHLYDTELDVERIAVLMNMSKSTLYRRIKSISGLAPSDVINLIRLRRSADLINAGNFRINEVAKEVGYQYPAQFRRNFLKQFRMSPGDFIEKVKKAFHGNKQAV